MDEFLQFTFNGLAIGAIYALVAVGLTLGIGVARFFNFAQGQVVTLGAFLGATLVAVNVPYLATIPLVVVAIAGLGIALRGVIVRFAGQNTLIIFLATLGAGIVIQYTITLIWGAHQRIIPTPFGEARQISEVVLSDAKLFLLGVSVPVILGLHLMLTRTDVGRRLRACAENRDVASLLGIDVPWTMRSAVALGTGLAGLAGVLIGALFEFDPFGGGIFLLKGLAATLVGGLGSVSGAVVAGVLLGMLETYATAYGVPVGFYHFGPEWQNGYAFVLMIVVLALRPSGLFRGTGAL